MKTYVVGTHSYLQMRRFFFFNQKIHVLIVFWASTHTLMSTHNICFHGEIRKLLCGYPLLSETKSLEAPITKTCLFKYTENFTTKKWKFSDKNFWYFSYFWSKHRLWYSLEPPQWGSSNEYHNLCFWSKIRKIMYTPVTPVLLYKSGV